MRFGHGGKAFHSRGFVRIGGEANDIGPKLRERSEVIGLHRLLTRQVQDARFVRRWNAACDDLQGQGFQVKE